MRATGTFTIQKWDEAPCFEEAGKTKLTRASVALALEGDLEATCASESVMAYPDGAPALFTSFATVSGRLAGRAGSFVLQGSGSYVDGTATESWTIVPGSATDELAGLRGSGGYVATHDDRDWHLDYEFVDA